MIRTIRLSPRIDNFQLAKNIVGIIAICAVAMALLGCARAPAEPVVDMRGVDYGQYQNDLNECRAYAEQVDAAGSGAEGAAVGAVGGALFGALLGAIVHAPAAGAAIGAASGGLGGASGGLTGAMIRKNTIMRNCLAHRGYVVLG